MFSCKLNEATTEKTTLIASKSSLIINELVLEVKTLFGLAVIRGNATGYWGAVSVAKLDAMDIF